MVATPVARFPYAVAPGLRLPVPVRRDVERLVKWLAARSAEAGLTIRAIRVSRWQSPETPQNRETVVEVWVEGPDDAAVRLWEDAGSFVAELPSASHEHSRVPLSIGMHWR
jgi:hypothetical protein